MKNINCSILAFLMFTSITISQDHSYWEAAIPGEKIYTIYFFVDEKVIAVSADNEYFLSTDEGIKWQLNKIRSIAELKNETQNLIVDIHCAIIHTTDGGENWYPYSSGKLEHFCRVYLKDPNVGYQTAFEFLTKVISEINSRLKDSPLEALNLPPQQCTEYYTNADEGWALGWCIKNFKSNDKNQK